MAVQPLLDKLSALWNEYKAAIAKREVFSLDRNYLPAVVELQESPPSPTARYFLRGILIFITITFLWSILGKVDVVATGQGKTVPTGRVKVIQPAETGIIKAIHVQDGQHIKAGDVLVELDVTLTEADVEKLRQELSMTEADMARLNALLTGKTPKFSKDLSKETLLTQQSLFQQAHEQQLAEIETLKQQYTQKKQELEGAKAQQSKLSKTLPLITERAKSYARLAAQNYVAKNQSMAIEEERLNQYYDLENQKAKAAELTAQIQGVKEQITASLAAFQHKVLNELNDKSQRRVELAQELAKAEQRNRMQSLASPIDGSVQELRVHTVGGVVTPAQELMKIVPFEDALEAEVLIQNKDVGFVKEGQPVRVKLEAFPFTKYGILQGKVKKLSLDATQDEKLGLVYLARISLDDATLKVGGKTLILGSGLAVTAEVKTGTRRIIEYFLSPIMEYADEAIRER